VGGRAEMAEVIGRELHLHTLRGALLGWRHDSGVADEDVQGPRQAATNAAVEP